jgi:hypothetical protein
MFFAYALGRVLIRVRRNRQPFAKAMTWVLRTAAALTALLWTRQFDAVGIVFLGLIALSFAAGVYIETRPRKTEEIHLFREE